MGLFDSWSQKKRAKEAAAQMWDLLKKGYNFEVPFILDKNDLTVQAITELQRRHPKVQLRMYQSRGLVLGLFRGEGMRGNRGIGDSILDHFSQSGHLGEGFENIKAEDLLAGHEKFLIGQHIDPKQAEREAQTERMIREAISVGSVKADDTGLSATLTPAAPEATDGAKQE